MFIEAIVNENINREYLTLEIGDKISGNVKSLKQNFINNPECVDITYKYDDKGEPIEFDVIEKVFRINLKEGSLKKVDCGCGNIASREINSEYLCNECEYEEPEDFSYLSQTPWESD